MRYIIFFLMLIVMFSGLAQNLHSQINLGDVKKKEEERRKATGKSKIAITDSNIQKAGGGAKSSGFVQAQTVPESSNASQQQSQPNTDAQKAVTEEYWRERKAKLDNTIKEFQETIDKEEADLKKLWRDYQDQADETHRKDKMAEISRITTTLESDKAKLRQAKAELEGLPEEARKAGVPPGWVR